MKSSFLSTSCRVGTSCVSLLNRAAIQRTTASLATATKTDSQPSGKGSASKEKQDAAPVSKEKAVKPVRVSNSFVMNLFRGQFHPNELFPYPNILTEEQKENTKMLIDPIWKFFEEKNDAAKNDNMEKVRQFIIILFIFSYEIFILV